MSATQQFAVQLIVSIATVIGSGVASAIVTFRLNKQRDETILRRQKLEQLLLAVDSYITALVSHFMIYERCARGEYSFDAANDMVISQGVAEDRPFQNARMLIAIYFPKLQPELDAIITCRDLGSAAIREFKEAYKAGTFTSARVAEGLIEINSLLCNREEAFRTAAYGIARSFDKQSIAVAIM